jgi:hypothetical protein
MCRINGSSSGYGSLDLSNCCRSEIAEKIVERVVSRGGEDGKFVFEREQRLNSTVLVYFELR